MFFGLGMEKELKAQKKRFDAIHTEFIDVEWRGNLKKLKKSFRPFGRKIHKLAIWNVKSKKVENLLMTLIRDFIAQNQN